MPPNVTTAIPPSSGKAPSNHKQADSGKAPSNRKHPNLPHRQAKKKGAKVKKREKKGFVPTERAREIRDAAEILRLHGFDATDFRRVRTGYTGTTNKPGDLPALQKPEEDLTDEILYERKHRRKRRNYFSDIRRPNISKEQLTWLQRRSNLVPDLPDSFFKAQ